MLWIVTLLSKGNAIWATLKSHWRIVLGVVYSVALILVTHLHDLRECKNDALQAQNVVLEKQVKVVHDVKIIHDKVSSLPDGAAASQLRAGWQRN